MASLEVATSPSASAATSRSTTSTSTPSRAASPGSSARTAPARRRSSTSSPACSRRTRAACVLDGSDITELSPHQAGPARAWPARSSASSCSACSTRAREHPRRRRHPHGLVARQGRPGRGRRADHRPHRPAGGRRRAGRRAADRPVPARRARPVARHQAEGAAARRARVGSGRDRDRRSSATLLQELAAEGMAVVLVEHDVQLVMACADACTCSTSAGSSRSGTRPRSRRNEAVLAAYLGEPATRRAPVNVLELRGIRAAYERIDVLFGVDLAVPEGSVVALLGPNGAGKTTTLRVAAGLHPPTRGRRARRRPAGQRRPARGARPARALPDPRGRGHLPEPHRPREPPDDDLHRHVRSPTIEERRVRALPPAQGAAHPDRGDAVSGGEQQMLAMARGLATDPALLHPRRAVDGAGADHRRGAVRDRGPGRPARACRSWSSSSSPAPCSAWPTTRPSWCTAGSHARVARPSCETNLSKAYPGRHDGGGMIESHERVEEFKQEIADMKVRDPATGRDRVWLRVGIALMVVGLGVAIGAYFMSHGTSNPLSQNDALVLGARRPHRRGRRRRAVPALLDRRVPALLARPLHLRAAGPDRPHRRERLDR